MVIVTLMLWMGSLFAGELSTREDYQLEPFALTTDEITQRDPGLVNPHLATWMLDRKVQLGGLHAVPKVAPATGWDVEVSGLWIASRGLVRGAGPWFSKLEEFSCQARPDVGFATLEGAQRALAVAREEWVRILKNESTALQILLKRVSGETEAKVLDQAEEVLRSWLQGVTAKWRESTPAKARRAEWQFYQEEARCRSRGVQKKISTQGGISSVRQRMEPALPASVEALRAQKLLARAPAKLWARPGYPKEFYFSVHVDTFFAGKALTGKFLIDPGAPRSVVSPTWLENQGVHLAWILEKSIVPRHVQFSLPMQTSRPVGTLANTVNLDQVRLAGLLIPFHQFLLKDIDFFSPPKQESSCCDGVLGADFVRQFPMEFQQEAPAEVRVWPQKEFRSAALFWDEIHMSATGEILQTQGSPRGDQVLSWMARKGLEKSHYVLDLPHGRFWWF